jgi:RNA polymerase sigma-70 factor (ECF subfamily)
MLGYRGGDDQAFAQLFARHRSRLYRFVRRMAPVAADTEEIVQDTWIAVIQGRHRYLARARFVTYLFAIAHRRTQDRWRRRGRRSETTLPAHDPLPAPACDDPAEAAVLSAMEQALSSALRGLPAEQREAFLLRAEGDLGVAEIAAVMGVSRETTKSRLRYAYQHLRRSLEEWRQ